MIKYNSNTINDWYFDTSDIIKVYRNNAVCYYKITTSGGTSAQTPCFAVVDDISQYSDTEFENVFQTSNEKWYKLNNINQYEEYGVYGSGRTITYYDGKLTIDGDYEYQYSGGSWVNVGEVSGSTASLPNVPFTVNINANNYDANTKTFAKTQGQLVDTDIVVTAGTPTVNDGYLTIANGTRATISGYQSYFNRDNNNPNLTIISKQRTEDNYCHMFANRDTNYNWMYRPYSNKLALHGIREIGSIAVTTQPVIESVRVDSSRNVKYNNYTDNTTSTTAPFQYGGTNIGKFALFAGFGTSDGEWFDGDFYWVYMSQSTLTDEQVQQVIDYNEGGGGKTEYPVYYSEMQDPPNNLSFSSMTEAEEYECPWVGMIATIDGDRYVFSGDSISGYEWVYNPSRLPVGYTEVEYVQNTGTSTINTNFYPNTNTRVLCEMEMITTQTYPKLFGAGTWNVDNSLFIEFGNTLSVHWIGAAAVNYSNYPQSFAFAKHEYDLNKGNLYIDDTLVGTKSYSSVVSVSSPFGIFSYINGSTAGNADEHFLGKLYTFKIYDDGTLVREFIPAKRDSDNIAGLYDIVNNVFYTPMETNVPLVAGNPV